MDRVSQAREVIRTRLDLLPQLLLAGARSGCRPIGSAAGGDPGHAIHRRGWTFSRATGLTTEVGSVLSHGAVVACEYGLPAVAGFPGVTRRVKTGEMLRVDGNTGELRRVTSGTA